MPSPRHRGEPADEASTPVMQGSHRTRPTVLTDDQVRSISGSLPPRCRNADKWKLCYSTLEHGVSMHTLYRNCAGLDNVVLVIMTDRGAVLGAFSPERFEVQHGQHYFGSRETFLYKFDPEFEIYRWAMNNDYFVLCTHDCVAFGGGNNFGILLDEALLTGTTGRCDTFDSPPLLPTKGDDDSAPFVIYALEVCPWQCVGATHARARAQAHTPSAPCPNHCENQELNSLNSLGLALSKRVKTPCTNDCALSDHWSTSQCHGKTQQCLRGVFCWGRWRCISRAHALSARSLCHPSVHCRCLAPGFAVWRCGTSRSSRATWRTWTRRRRASRTGGTRSGAAGRAPPSSSSPAGGPSTPRPLRKGPSALRVIGTFLLMAVGLGAYNRLHATHGAGVFTAVNNTHKLFSSNAFRVTSLVPQGRPPEPGAGAHATIPHARGAHAHDRHAPADGARDPTPSPRAAARAAPASDANGSHQQAAEDPPGPQTALQRGPVRQVPPPETFHAGPLQADVPLGHRVVAEDVVGPEVLPDSDTPEGVEPTSTRTPRAPTPPRRTRPEDAGQEGERGWTPSLRPEWEKMKGGRRKH